MDRDRIITAIQRFARSPKNVRFDDLIALLDTHLKPMFPDYSHHGNPHHAFTVGGQTFNISRPHKSSFVKKVYVEKFLAAMEAVGLYAPEEEE